MLKLGPSPRPFFFTHDTAEGANIDESIEVRFNDGSVAKISGTCRVMMPTSDEQAKALMTTYSFKNYKDLEQRFIKPIIRNALRTTANLMNARQSYAEGRSDFVSWSWDQISNGQYKTRLKSVSRLRILKLAR